jgi:two-component system, sensor histidine kinase PdtaS
MFRESSLFQFKNGDHTCVFYRSDKELMEVLTPFVADGLRRGERVFCAQRPEILKRLTHDLIFLGLNPDYERESGALDLLTEEEAYFPHSQFEPLAMMDMLIRSIYTARAKGFTSFRSAGELSWAVQGRNECDRVVGYEKLVEEYYPGRPAIGLCQYPMDKFEPSVLRAVLASHRMQISDTSPGSNHCSIHFRNEGWTAEMVADKITTEPRYYYVVQHSQPFEIAGWGVSNDFDSASASIGKLALHS